jgi:hypothetical protein
VGQFSVGDNTFAQIQKTNPTTAEKLKAFLTTKAFDDSKVGFLPPLLTFHPQRRHDRRPSS